MLRARGVVLRAKFVGGDTLFHPLQGIKVRKQARRWGLTDQIEFMGPLPHDQVLQAVATAELSIFPSLYSDVPPNVVKEALSLKVPVIVTPTLGMGELVQHGHSGLIVPKNDPAALADAIAWALQNPKEMQRMALGGYSILANKFDIAETSVQRSDYYEQLLARPTR